MRILDLLLPQVLLITKQTIMHSLGSNNAEFRLLGRFYWIPSLAKCLQLWYYKVSVYITKLVQRNRERNVQEFVMFSKISALSRCMHTSICMFIYHYRHYRHVLHNTKHQSDSLYTTIDTTDIYYTIIDSNKLYRHDLIYTGIAKAFTSKNRNKC